jgi:pimeloyl-ACP methyl ester carboxylesterase
MPADVLTSIDFQEERFTVQGRELRCLVGGDGPTIVFIHGIGGLRQAPTHDFLAADHRVVLVELPGFATDGRDDEFMPPPFEEYVSIVRDLLSGVVGPSYVLVGTSFGARLATAVANGSTDVDGLILLSPVVITDGLRMPGPNDPPATLVAHPERVALALVEPAQRARQVRLAHHYMGDDLSEMVRRLAQPTVVAFGTSDEAVSPSIGRRYVELNSEIFLTFFYDSGHLIEFDRPESLCNLVRNFVRYKRDFHLVRESGLLYV